MEWKLLSVVFTSVFIAEMADKTQLVTLLFATDQPGNRLAIFLAASAALVTTTAIGVAAGAVLSEVVDQRVLSLVAGAGFVVIGGWILFGALTGQAS